MTNLAKHIIVARVENRPSMLEKSMYDSWASHILLFIKGKKHVGMMLNVHDNEWSKFVTDVKLAKSLYTTNYDQLYAYLSQHERHANEVHITRERYPDPLALVANSQTLYNPLSHHNIQTLILEEESRSKMLDKQNDLISIEKKIKISPIDYSKLNKIKEDFGKRFVTQKELSAEQAFWLKHSSFSETPATSHTHVRIEAPSEFPKRTTSDAITAGAWGFEHTKACFVTKIIPFLKVLKDTFNAFDRTLLDEITKVQTVFNQMEAVVDQCSLRTQLNQEAFQKNNFRENQNAPTFNQLFELNELKAQSQEKDTVIRKLKDRIKSLSGKDSVENVKKDIDEIETINIELEHNQFDSIRKTRVQSKEHCDSLIAQINAKSVENLDLNAQLQEKVFAITALKNELRKLKGKNVVDTAVSKPNATIAPRMFKLDIEPISHKLKNNKDAHEVYIEKTIENTDTLCGFIERARTQNPSEPLLEFACMFTKHVQELLVYVSQTCPNLPTPGEKLVAVGIKEQDRKRVKPTTSASGSKPSGNTKNNRITRPSSSNQ
ncbi:hypothetical protein Tco_1314368 [Tanacetum coccineum]